MTLLHKKDGLTDAEYIVKYSLLYFNMKKIKDDSIQKIMESDSVV